MSSPSQPTQTDIKVNDESLPPQLHAGKVGYGPNYRTGPTLEEKVAGLKEELMGKVTHNKDRIHHGHEIRTGQEKRKKMTGEDEPNPFTGAEVDHDAAGLKDDKSNTQSNIGSTTSENAIYSEPTSNSPHPTIASTRGHNSNSSAAHSQSRTAQTPSTSSFNDNHTTPDLTEGAPSSEDNNHVSSTSHSLEPASDMNNDSKTPLKRISRNASNNASEHLSNISNSTGQKVHDHTISSDTDSLSRSTYKPSPENVMLNLKDQNRSGQASKKGGNTIENKYLN